MGDFTLVSADQLRAQVMRARAVVANTANLPKLPMSELPGWMHCPGDNGGDEVTPLLLASPSSGSAGAGSAPAPLILRLLPVIFYVLFASAVCTVSLLAIHSRQRRYRPDGPLS